LNFVNLIHKNVAGHFLTPLKSLLRAKYRYGFSKRLRQPIILIKSTTYNDLLGSVNARQKEALTSRALEVMNTQLIGLGNHRIQVSRIGGLHTGRITEFFLGKS
jgi:hypothetical protein